jgi:hypothetical protein
MYFINVQYLVEKVYKLKNVNNLQGGAQNDPVFDLAFIIQPCSK